MKMIPVLEVLMSAMGIQIVQVPEMKMNKLVVRMQTTANYAWQYYKLAKCTTVVMNGY